MTRPDWLRWIFYLVLGRLFHRPPLLAALSRALQRAGAPVACDPEEVRTVYRRGDDFSNRAHFDQLIAGDFVIGMDSGPHQSRERDAVHGCLPDPPRFGALAGAEAATRARAIGVDVARGGRFDLINDYLVFVAWSGLRGIFDTPSAAAVEGVSATAPPLARDAALTVLFRELRHVGGHLVVGGVAPRSVRVRAQTCADALNRRVARSLVEIRAHWQPACPYAARTAQRQAVGLMWVGHPAMVQAGALVFQELQSRPDDYARLHASVGLRLQTLGDAAWTDAPLRDELRGHVLECLRLRPPFPFLSRLLPRDADLQLGALAKVRTIAAGRSVYLSIAAALRGRTGYEPALALAAWREPDALPIFGAGPRACVAGEHVVELLVSALLGLLSLPRLRFADVGRGRIVYDGPILTRMRVEAAT